MLIGQKLHAESSKLRRPEATAPTQSPAVQCHSGQEATVAAPSREAVAPVVPWREKAIRQESDDTEERTERRQEARNKKRCLYSEQNVGEILA